MSTYNFLDKTGLGLVWDKIKALIPTKTSDLRNDSGFLTSYTETDPVYSSSVAAGISSSDITNWNNKTSNTGTITEVKTTAGTHTAIDIISGTASFKVPTKTSHLTNDSGFITNAGVTSFNGGTGAITYTAPVTSVNSKTGVVSLTASDVGALPSSTSIPTKTSDLTNDSGFITDISGKVDKAGDSMSGNLIFNDGYCVKYKKSASTALETPERTIQLKVNGQSGAGDGAYTVMRFGIEPSSQEQKVIIDGVYTPTGSSSSYENYIASKKYVDNKVPTKTSDLTNDSGFITTLTAESPITLENNIIGFDGYNVSTTRTTLCNVSATTTSTGNFNYSDLPYSTFIDADTIIVTFDGTEYTCQKSGNSNTIMYGEADSEGPIYTNYPFNILSIDGTGNELYTETAGTHTIKIEAVGDIVTVSSDFAKARGYSVSTTNTTLCEESVTTVAGEGYIGGQLVYSTVIAASTLIVTLNGTAYTCFRRDDGDYGYEYGATYSIDLGGYDFSTYPFCFYSGVTGENRIYTETAGTYTVKIGVVVDNVTVLSDFETAVKDVDSVFIAEYNVTSFYDVDKAFKSGKALFCKRGYSIAPLIMYEPMYNHYQFGGMTNLSNVGYFGIDSGGWEGVTNYPLNKTYSLSISNNRITLTPSSGTASYIDLPVYDGGVS